MKEKRFFTVGPTLEIRGYHYGESFPLRLSLFEGGMARGELEAERTDDGILVLHYHPSSGEKPDLVVEAIRLFARICSWFDRHKSRLKTPAIEAIKDWQSDGFVMDGEGWLVRQPGPFLASEKDEGYMNIYDDPYTIPWNFVPLETDVYEELLAPGLPSLKILDLGCGYGKNAQILEVCGHEVFGLDVAAQAVARWQELTTYPERYQSCSATELPWRDAFFDVVLDIGCIHCLKASDIKYAVKEARRVLKPNGHLYSRIFTPQSEAWLRAQPFETHKFGFKPEAATELFTSHFDVTIHKQESWATFIKGRARDTSLDQAFEEGLS